MEMYDDIYDLERVFYPDDDNPSCVLWSLWHDLCSTSTDEIVVETTQKIAPTKSQIQRETQ